MIFPLAFFAQAIESMVVAWKWIFRCNFTCSHSDQWNRLALSRICIFCSCDLYDGISNRWIWSVRLLRWFQCNNQKPIRANCRSLHGRNVDQEIFNDVICGYYCDEHRDDTHQMANLAATTQICIYDFLLCVPSRLHCNVWGGSMNWTTKGLGDDVSAFYKSKRVCDYFRMLFWRESRSI